MRKLKVFLTAAIFLSGCTLGNVSTLDSLHGQAFAGIIIAGNGSLEDLFNASGVIHDRLVKSGVQFCNACPELLSRMDDKNISAASVVETRLLMKKIDFHPDAFEGKAKPGWAIVEFDGKGHFSYKVFVDITPAQFDKMIYRHWGRPVSRLLLL